tara:strand:- start:2388 stop:2744 length:357 start_codon:yes stop_codon:yes gene_type:complete
MAISKHISFKNINDIPLPQLELRRCWNPSYLEDMSIINHNRKYNIKYLNLIFYHVNEIRFNKYIHHQYRCELNFIFIKISKHLKKNIIDKILSYVSNVNETSINRKNIFNYSWDIFYH